MVLHCLYQVGCLGSKTRIYYLLHRPVFILIPIASHSLTSKGTRAVVLYVFAIAEASSGLLCYKLAGFIKAY